MKIKKIINKITLAVTLLAAFNVFAEDKYDIVPEKSTLAWHASKVTGEHNGTVDIKGGSVMVDGEKVNSGKFKIDMSSIVVLDIKDEKTNQKLVNHLKSDDFFSVENHPTSNFKIKSVEMGDAKSKVTGELTIKGITHEINFPAVITMKDNKYMAKAEFQIDRSKWDVRYGSGSFFKGLGDKLIHDEINYKLDLVFEKSDSDKMTMN